MIIREGDIAKSFFIILEGSASVIKVVQDDIVRKKVGRRVLHVKPALNY